MDELLLDSSYLFPVFGVALEYRNFESIFSMLPEKYLVKYNPVSLIEAKWYVLRESKKKDSDDDDDEKDSLLQRYRKGLLSLQRDQRIESTPLTNEQIEEISDSLRFVIRDYFDRLIYSTAAYLSCTMLTEDGALHELFRKADNSDLPKPKQMIKWKNLSP